jgi:hypothetical protein
VNHKWSTLAMEMADAGMISWEQLAMTALVYMSEQDVEHMLRVNDLMLLLEDQLDEDELDEDQLDDWTA